MRVICVDDERPILENFRSKAKNLAEIESLKLFQSANEAIAWTQENPVDVAFLDMSMAEMNGIELAKRLKKIDSDIRIIFVTAYAQYALEAFHVDAVGYLLKPYTSDEIQHELEKASLVRPHPKKQVEIRTIPDFIVLVDGVPMHFDRAKPEELLALLVDHAGVGLTSGEAIACLWPDRPTDENTLTLYRVTFHRLMEKLKAAGIEHIIGSEGRKRYIHTEQVDCDLYRLLSGNKFDLQNYSGEYMKEYSWAESRNAQLSSLKSAGRIPNKKTV